MLDMAKINLDKEQIASVCKKHFPEFDVVVLGEGVHEEFFHIAFVKVAVADLDSISQREKTLRSELCDMPLNVQLKCIPHNHDPRKYTAF